jgi:glycosyltransferase involved in cell wall biosynthesis
MSEYTLAGESAGARNPRRPCLAYVVNSLNPGGTEKLVFEMSLAFAARYDMLVVCLDDTGPWGRELRARGIEVYCVGRQPGLDLAMPLVLARLFRARGVQIIHAHQCTPWFYSALSRLFYSKPKLLLEEHGRFFPEIENRKRACVNRLLIKPLTHRFVAVSDDIRTRLEKYEGLDARQIEVIYNGVGPQTQLDATARHAMRAGLGFGPDDFVVGTVGRFDPIKNLPMLIESVAVARTRVPAVRGLLVGDGPQMGQVRRLIDERKLADAIHLTGFRQDARALAQCMDLFVLSSFSEGTSMALLEAMAAEVAVAVTRVGGNPEVVENGVTGWIVGSGAVNELADAICDAALNPGQRAARAAAGRRCFVERFDFERMLAQYEARYRQLVPGAADGRPETQAA